MMKRILILKQGIIDGDTVRDILKVFPDIENSFKQRKDYDEYYFYNAHVELTIDTITKLNNLGFSVTIDSTEVVID